ncbi:hypothetical protein EYF80_039250 [Liparis tanakae]|uniref:Uncharacterized protein n=1 Tax=Liparis tanakae TaxID=230148 RepID=A0A4Z2GAJ8_9TELE|nr:hypothetical protein EYF80_039250 [Liparis tanakae]
MIHMRTNQLCVFGNTAEHDPGLDLASFHLPNGLASFFVPPVSRWSLPSATKMATVEAAKCPAEHKLNTIVVKKL